MGQTRSCPTSSAGGSKKSKKGKKGKNVGFFALFALLALFASLCVSMKEAGLGDVRHQFPLSQRIIKTPCPSLKIPATHPVISVARVAASNARNPRPARSSRRDGARAAVPPTKIATEAT